MAIRARLPKKRINKLQESVINQKEKMSFVGRIQLFPTVDCDPKKAVINDSFIHGILKHKDKSRLTPLDKPASSKALEACQNR